MATQNNSLNWGKFQQVNEVAEHDRVIRIPDICLQAWQGEEDRIGTVTEINLQQGDDYCITVKFPAEQGKEELEDTFRLDELLFERAANVEKIEHKIKKYEEDAGYAERYKFAGDFLNRIAKSVGTTSKCITITKNKKGNESITHYLTSQFSDLKEKIVGIVLLDNYNEDYFLNLLRTTRSNNKANWVCAFKYGLDQNDKIFLAYNEEFDKYIIYVKDIPAHKDVEEKFKIYKEAIDKELNALKYSITKLLATSAGKNKKILSDNLSNLISNRSNLIEQLRDSETHIENVTNSIEHLHDFDEQVALDELTKLQNMQDEFQKFYMDGNKIIAVTNDIHISYMDQDYKLHQYKIAAWGENDNRLRLKFEIFKKNAKVQGEYIHPHINTSGSACLGVALDEQELNRKIKELEKKKNKYTAEVYEEAKKMLEEHPPMKNTEEMLNEWWNTGKLHKLFMNLYDFLCSYNDKGPYHQLVYMLPKESKKIYCEICDETGHNKETCPNKFICPICNRELSKFDETDHMVEIHRMTKCDECSDWIGNDEGAMDKHYIEKHGWKKCVECNMIFETQDELDQHMEENHK